MHRDFLMRQIKSITTAIGEMIFNKPSSGYEVQSEVRQLESDLLYILLCNMVNEKDINGAEDLLFEMLEKDNNDHLLIATDFYSRLNCMTDHDLQQANFSREEIERGLNEIKKIYGLPI